MCEGGALSSSGEGGCQGICGVLVHRIRVLGAHPKRPTHPPPAMYSIWPLASRALDLPAFLIMRCFGLAAGH